MVDFNEMSRLEQVRLAAADRFIDWRVKNAAQLQGAPTPTREEYARILRDVNRESPVRLDWDAFMAMPEGEFLAEFSGILRHVNDDGSLRRNYRPGFAK